MRSYFQCHIEGRRLLLPWLVALVLTVGTAWVYGAVLMPAAPADPRLDGHFLLGVLWTLSLGICLLAAQCVYYYFFVRATLRGTSLYGEAVEADYDPKQYVRLCAKGILLSAVTCGIYLPWLVVSLVRYFASAVIHRLFLCEEPRYRGRGSVLFAYEVLLGVVPMVILPFAASFFLLAGVDNRHIGAVFSQFQGDSPADAPGSPGNQSDFSVQHDEDRPFKMVKVDSREAASST